MYAVPDGIGREPPQARGPRPWKALDEAVPIAKARGFIRMAMGGPERIYDIAIISMSG
jgi:hypothetical protein